MKHASSACAAQWPKPRRRQSAPSSACIALPRGEVGGCSASRARSVASAWRVKGGEAGEVLIGHGLQSHASLRRWTPPHECSWQPRASRRGADFPTVAEGGPAKTVALSIPQRRAGAPHRELVLHQRQREGVLIPVVGQRGGAVDPALHLAHRRRKLGVRCRSRRRVLHFRRQRRRQRGGAREEGGAQRGALLAHLLVGLLVGVGRVGVGVVHLRDAAECSLGKEGGRRRRRERKTEGET